MEQPNEENDLASFKLQMRGVKDLVDSGIKQLPKFYVHDVQQQASNSSSKLPVIDLGQVHSSNSVRANVVEEISKACKEWGFFQVVNHGVSSAVMEKMIEAVKEFFDMPVEERMEYYSDDMQELVRFGTSHNPSKENVLEWKDYLRHPCLPFEEVFPKWPQKPSSYKETAKVYCQAVKELVAVLLELLSEGLGLEREYLGKSFGQHAQVMQANYYPPCPNSELAVGVSEHCDAGGVTVLLQNNVEGLEVFKNGEWILVPPLKDALVINLGDHSQIMTNGLYKSVMHRGRVNSETLRISIATFYQPSRDAWTGPIPELLSEKNPALYKQLPFGDFLNNFFAAKLQGKAFVDSMKIC